MLGKLTPREQDVIKLVVKGYNNQQIADKLCIAYTTVRQHIINIYQKTDLCGHIPQSVLRLRLALIYLKENPIFLAEINTEEF